MFDSPGQITIIGLLPAFQMACYTNRIHKVAAMGLLYFFMKNPARVAIDASNFVSSPSGARQEGNFDIMQQRP